MAQRGNWALQLKVQLHIIYLGSLLLHCPFAVVLQRRVRASGLPSRCHRRQLGVLELVGCLLAELRCGRAERREAVQQPHVSERGLLRAEKEPNASDGLVKLGLSPAQPGPSQVCTAQQRRGARMWLSS